MEDNKELYELLIKAPSLKGANSLKTYENFQQKFNTPEAQEGLYNILKKAPEFANSKTLTDFNTFKGKFFTPTVEENLAPTSAITPPVKQTQTPTGILGTGELKSDFSYKPIDYSKVNEEQAQYAIRGYIDATSPDYERGYMSMGKLAREKNEVEFFKDKSIPLVEKQAKLKEIQTSLQDKKQSIDYLDYEIRQLENKKNNLTEAGYSEDLPIVKDYDSQIRALKEQRVGMDLVQINQLQRNLNQTIPSITNVEDEITINAFTNPNYIATLNSQSVLDYAGKLGVNIMEMGNNPLVQETLYEESANIQTIKSPITPDTRVMQSSGNPLWKNQEYQAYGLSKIMDNYNEQLTGKIEEFNQIADQYKELVDDYNENPSQKSLEKIEQFKNTILKPAENQINTLQDGLKKLVDISTSSNNFIELNQKRRQDYIEALNYNPDSYIDNIRVGLQSFANKNTNMLFGLQQAATLPTKLFRNDVEYDVANLGAVRRQRETNFTIPTAYQTAEMFKDGKISSPNFPVIAGKALETTAFSLEVGAITALSGGSANAIIPVATMMSYGDIYMAHREAGLTDGQASSLAFVQALIEGVTERISPLEAKFFNPETYAKQGLKFATKREAIEQLYRSVAGKAPSDNVLNFLLNKAILPTATAAYTTLQETAEEVAGDLLNAPIEQLAAKNIEGYNYQPTDWESIKNTALTSIVTMLPMGVFGGGTKFMEKQVPSYQLQIAKNPELYLSSLQYELGKGRIPEINAKNGTILSSEEMYQSSVKEINKLSELYSTNKAIINNLDNDAQQAQYLYLVREKAKLTEDLAKYPAQLATIKKDGVSLLEKYEEASTKLDNQLDKLNEIAFTNISLSPEERQKKQEKILISNTTSKFTDEFISKLTSPELIELYKGNIASRYEYLPTEAVKNAIAPILQKLDVQLNNIINPQAAAPIVEEVIEPEVIEEVPTEIEQIDTSLPINEQISSLVNLREQAILSDNTALADQYSEQLKALEAKQAEEAIKENQIEFQGKTFNKGNFIEKKGETGIWQITGINEDGTLAITKFKKENGQLVPLTVTKISNINDIIGDEIPKSKALAQIADVKIAEEVIPEEVLEEKAAVVEEVKEQITEENKKTEQELNKNLSEKQTPSTVVRTIGVYRDAEKDDPSVITVENTLKSIKQQAINENKTFSELGYYVSVVKGGTLPLNKRRITTQNYINSKLGGDVTKDEGKVAVITDNTGALLYFDINGNPTTAENGRIVEMNIPKINDNKGVLELNDTSLTLIEPSQQELSKINNIRNSEKTYEIANISNGIVDKNSKEPTSILEHGYSLNQIEITIPSQNLRKLKAGNAYAKFPNSDEWHQLHTPKLTPDVIDAILELFERNKPENRDKFSSLPEYMKDFYNRVLYIEKLIGTTSTGLQFNRGTKEIAPFISYRGKTLTKEEAREVLSYIEQRVPFESKQQMNASFDLILFKDGKFETKNYPQFKQYIAENFKISLKLGANPNKVNRYIEFGDEVVSTAPFVAPEIATESPLLPIETPLKEAPKKINVRKFKDTEDDLSFLERSKTLITPRTTTEEEQKAEEWWKTTPIRKNITFNDFRDIINSDAFATFQNASVSLWNAGKFSDLYHEAWHVFSQLYLTLDQKKALYNEARKTLGNLSDFQIEEQIAEDFRKYVLSGQKLILNRRPARNSIFRKIYDFLKELFTGNVSLQTYYERLYTGNINKYQYKLSNAQFGVLNSSISSSNRTLSEAEARQLNSVIDTIISIKLKSNNAPISALFRKKGAIEGMYNSVYKTLAKQLELLGEYYNNQIDNNAEEAELQELKKDYTNLEFAVDNWEKVKAHHKIYSKYLKVSKELVEDGNEEEATREGIVYEEGDKSSRDLASFRVLYLIASLSKYENGKQVPNKFISTLIKDGEKDILPATVDFDKTWNLLSKELQGILDYKQMYSKLDTISKRKPEIADLMKFLPSPEKEDLSLNELNLKTAFIQALSKPLIQMYRPTISIYGDIVSNKTYKSSSSVISKLKSDLFISFQEKEEDEYITKTLQGNILNTKKILEDFPKDKIVSSKAIREKFLSAIGLDMSPNTVNSDEYKTIVYPERVEKEGKRDAILSIYEAIERWHINSLKPGINYDVFEKGLTKPLEQLAKDEYEFTGVGSDIDTILAVEAEYNDEYYADNVTNANGDNVWQIQRWNALNKITNILNDDVSYPTYEALKASPYSYLFDIAANPDATNLYITSLFDIVTGDRRKDAKGNVIKINIFNEDGLEVKTEDVKSGAKTTQLTVNDKLIQDFTSLLTSGKKEHIRYGDKSSSYGTMITAFVNPITNRRQMLPVEIEDLRSSTLPEYAHEILKKALLSRFTRINSFYSSKTGDNYKNFNKNIDSLSVFDFLSNEKEIINDLKTTSPEEVYNKYEKQIKEETNKYFQKQTEINTKLFSKIPVNPEKYTDTNLLKKYTFETLVRAYTVNDWILDMEHLRLNFLDPTFYKNAQDVYKRLSKFTASGDIFINDEQTNATLTNLGRLQRDVLLAKGVEIAKNPETGYVNTVVFKEDIRDSEYYKEYNQKVNAGSYKEMKIADGQGYITLDEYRQAKLRQGSDHWTDNHEQVYRKLVKGEQLLSRELEDIPTIFPVMKLRVGGFINNNGIPIPVDYKFSLIPLLPNLIKNTPFEKINDNLIRQNVGIALFESGSKNSYIAPANDFYTDDSKITPYEGDYTINSIQYDFIFDQVNIEPELKKEVRFSTQLRKLLFNNLFKQKTPLDYKGTAKEWNSLSKSEKLKSSPSYSLEQEFGDVINTLVANERNKLIEKTGAVYNETTKTYTINPQKFSAYLEDEFIKRDLPDNILESISTNESGWKYPIDASVARNTIENIALSIVDNKLRKQKSFGEGLIQVSSSGFENTNFKLRNATEEEVLKYNGTNDLPFYRYDPNGTKAAKIKLSIASGDFKKLLYLKDEAGIPIIDNPNPLEKLNSLLKDEKWATEHKDYITLTAVRIPVQGLNSMEFMEVYEFLPEESGNIIIVSPELVAKSGGDFDVDKLTTLFPNIRLDENSNPKVYTQLSDSQIDGMYEYLQRVVEERKDSTIDSLLLNIFSITEGELASTIFDSGKIPSKTAFREIYKAKAAQNRLNSIIAETLALPSNFEQLITPNSTEMFEPLADELESIKNKRQGTPSNKKWNSILTVSEKLNQFKSNIGGKQSLGIGAVNNVFFSLLQRAGAYVNDTYINSFGTKKKVLYQLEHNSTKDGNISLSHIKDAEGKNFISEGISQLMNGWVDVSKKPWVFFINGTKEVASTMLYTIMAGTPSDIVVSFFNQPIIDDYLIELQALKSNIVAITNPNLYNKAKQEAKRRVYEKYLSPKDGKVTIGKKEFNLTNNPLDIYKIEKALGENIPENTFNSTKLKNVAFDKTNANSFEQAAILAHFFQLQDQANTLSNIQRTLSGDTTKPQSLESSQERVINRKIAINQGFLPEDVIKTLANESTIKAFTNDNTGVDRFISEFYANLFEITSNPVFLNFFEDTFNLPEEDKEKFNPSTGTMELIQEGNSIPFSSRYDIKEDWWRDIKNDFILYLYQNYIYQENSTQLTSSYIFELMQFDKTLGTNISLGTRLDEIKQKYPELAKNNLFIRYLAKDKSAKRRLVNIKYTKDTSDTQFANELTQDFKNLINSDNLEIQGFAKDLANFAFVQSGLSKSPLYFSNLIPTEFYSGKMAQVITGFQTLLKENPQEAISQLKAFYRMFKQFNSKYYNADIQGTRESYRQKDYQYPAAYDIIGDKAKALSDKMKNSINLPYTEELAKKHTKYLFVYDGNMMNSGLEGAAIIKNNPQNPEENTFGIPLKKIPRSTPEAYLSDETLEANKKLIDQSISSIQQKFKTGNYVRIVFPEGGITNTTATKLAEKAPLTAQYLSEQLTKFFDYSDNIVKLAPKELNFGEISPEEDTSTGDELTPCS